jgi:hypothetical protein
MNVHSATCSCSVELYKQWFTLADFFPKLEFSRGFLSAAVMAGDIIFFCLAGPVGDYTGAHTVIFRGVFPLYYSPEGRAKLRWALIGQVGRGALYFLGCRKAYKGAMDGARGGEYYTVHISKPLLYSEKIYAPVSRVAHLG